MAKNTFLSNKFTPSQLTKIYIIGAAFVVFILSWFFLQLSTPTKKETIETGEIKNVINSRGTRDVSIEAINEQFRELLAKNNKMNKEVKQLQELRLRDEDKIISSVLLTKDVLKLKATVNSLSGELQKQKASEKKRVDVLTDQLFNEMKIAAELGKTGKETLDIVKDKYISGEIKLAKQIPLNDLEPVELNINIVPKLTDENNKSDILPEVKRSHDGSSFVYTDKVDIPLDKIALSEPQYNKRSKLDSLDQSYRPSDNALVDKRTPQLMTIIESETIVEDENDFYIPRGSILTGQLITGVDVPTSASTSDNPFPVLVRIKKEAILANNNRMNEVNECFALMAGYGDLSSERAYFRGESITCILADKTVIEASLGAYAVGEDGKAGLKGRLVTKNGKVLGNTMLAGFGSGLASAFDVSPVPVISTTSDGQQQYQDVFSPDAVQGGFAKGASLAMEKLADYYLKLADAMHPVIEIGAGRTIDIIISKGSESEQ